MLSDGVTPADIPKALRARATRIDTGAFVGETDRYILPDIERPFASLCGNAE